MRPLLQITAICLSLLGISCKPQAEPAKIFRIAHTYGPGELLHKAAEKMAQEIKANSDGQLEVRIYPGGQLGNEREIVEGLKLGTADMIITGGAVIGWYAPEFGAFEAPFVWRDFDHLEKAWHAMLGSALRAALQSRSSASMLDLWHRGPRYLTTTTRIINHPDDLKGLKLRVPELEVYIKSWQAFGANVTPLPFSDMFMALRLGVVDGQENPLSAVYASHLYEVQKYVMETHHLIGFYLPAVGPRFKTRFTPAEQQIIMQAFNNTTTWHNHQVEEAEQTYRSKIEEAGVKFIPLDIEPFRRIAREGIPPQFKETWLSGLYEELSSM